MLSRVVYRTGKSTFIDMLSGRKSIGQLGGAVRVDGSAAQSSILTKTAPSATTCSWLPTSLGFEESPQYEKTLLLAVV